MNVVQRFRAVWRFLDVCATDHGAVAELAERVARLEKRSPEGPEKQQCEASGP
jgi:hypothetical protein